MRKQANPHSEGSVVNLIGLYIGAVSRNIPCTLSGASGPCLRCDAVARQPRAVRYEGSSSADIAINQPT